MKFVQFIIAAILAGLFLIAIVNFEVNMAQQNSLNSTLLKDDRINNTYIGAETQITESYKTVNSTSTSLEQTSVGEDAQTIPTITSFTTTIKGAGSGLYNLLFGGLLREGIGVPEIALTTLGAIMAVVIALLAWRVFKTGE